jgi:parvulin-like peptidyl-prolyl isomerase
MARPARLALASVVLVAAATACARAAPKSGADKPVLEVDSQVIYLDEFQKYLRDTLGESEGEQAPDGVESDPVTASRLFDQFVEEQLLLTQARKDGIQVSDAEVQAYLESQGLNETTPEAAEQGDAKAAADRFQARIRNTLMVQKFKDSVVLKDVQVTPQEIEQFFREHPAEFRASSRLVLRQILVDEEPLARRIRSELDRGASFQELAERHSLAPDRGQAVQYDEGDLPEDLQAALAPLAEGQTSDVVNSNGRYHIFRLESRPQKSPQALEDVRERIKFMLLRRKMDEAMARYLGELRSRLTLRVYHENLPFPYQAEAQS